MSRRTAALEAIIFAQRVEISRLRAELARALRALPPVAPPGWLTPKQVAHELGGISKPRVKQLIDSGQLWAVKVGPNVWIDKASPRLTEGPCVKAPTRRYG